MIDLIGGPSQDRTDNLFHAMLWVKSHIIDILRLMGRRNRQKPAQSAVFATKMLPIYQPVGSGSAGGELTRKNGFIRWTCHYYAGKDIRSRHWTEISLQGHLP
jgi:hypothetical protein